MTEPKDDRGLDTAAIDEGWGDAPEPTPPRGAKSGSRALAPLPAPPAPAEPGEPPPDDEIEFEVDAVARDSMPTFVHPNPLAFDHDPDAEELPKVPKPPPLPKLRGRKR